MINIESAFFFCYFSKQIICCPPTASLSVHHAELHFVWQNDGQCKAATMGQLSVVQDVYRDCRVYRYFCGVLLSFSISIDEKILTKLV